MLRTVPAEARGMKVDSVLLNKSVIAPICILFLVICYLSSTGLLKILTSHRICKGKLLLWLRVTPWKRMVEWTRRSIGECVQKFPDWPPGAGTANGTALWVSLVSFAAITLCVASQLVFIVVSVYFVIDSVRQTRTNQLLGKEFFLRS